jgi:hypothetical protein
MVYEWKPGSPIRLDAQAVGEHLERLEQVGPLTPEAIVEDARDEQSPTHPYFEWNDQDAAEQYRLVQARELVRAVIVVIEKPEATPEPLRVRAFSSLETQEGRSYVTTARALDDDGLRAQLLHSALADLRAFRMKYHKLQELADVIATIDQLRLDFSAVTA